MTESYGSTWADDEWESSSTVSETHTYQEVRDALRSLDLLLFRGNSWVSDYIMRASAAQAGSGDSEVAGRYSHVGIVVRGADLPAGHALRDPGAVYLWESTTTQGGRVPDVDGKFPRGVQVRSLDAVMADCEAGNGARAVAWCPLTEAARNASDLSPESLAGALARYAGRAYNRDACDLAAVACPRARCCRAAADCLRRCLFPRTAAARDEWLFCSELVARVFNDLGVFPEYVPPENALPTDFLPAGGAGERRTVDADREVPAVVALAVPIWGSE